MFRYDQNQPSKVKSSTQIKHIQSISFVSLPLYLYTINHIWSTEISLPVVHFCFVFLNYSNMSRGCDVVETATDMEIKLDIKGQWVKQLDLSGIFSSVK